MKIHNDTYLRTLPKDQLEALRDFLGWKVGSGMEVGNLCTEIDKILRQAKGVLIITTCNEEHLVKPTQPVKEIYIDGKLVHSSNQTVKREKA